MYPVILRAGNCDMVWEALGSKAFSWVCYLIDDFWVLCSKFGWIDRCMVWGCHRVEIEGFDQFRVNRYYYNTIIGFSARLHHYFSWEQLLEHQETSISFEPRWTVSYRRAIWPLGSLLLLKAPLNFLEGFQLYPTEIWNVWRERTGHQWWAWKFQGSI